uniref:MBD domain-containing protein n=1 Tax=Strigamia maritima TaxID=126957 RepID=T1IU14_STRMM
MQDCTMPSLILFRKSPLSLGHLKVPGSLAYVHIPKPDRHSKLEPRAWKGVMVGYAMGTRGYRLWVPISNNVYETKHVKFDESRIYKDVVQTYVGDTPLEISDGRDTHFIPHDDSGDSDDDDTPPPLPQAQLPTRPPSPPLPKPPLPITSKPLLKSGTAPTRIALRAPMLSKPGWEREEVKRQTGITKGKWDVYFYAPGRRAPLRSRPELKEYCEQELRVKFNADDFDWVPSQEKPGYLTSDDEEAQERPRYKEGANTIQSIQFFLLLNSAFKPFEWSARTQSGQSGCLIGLLFFAPRVLSAEMRMAVNDNDRVKVGLTDGSGMATSLGKLVYIYRPDRK